MPDPLVLAIGATREFGPATTRALALRSATCHVLLGERIALTGPSGSGKSTLLRLLGGLDTPSSGTVGWPALGPRTILRPRQITDVFQGPSLLTPLTVLDNVRLPLLLADADEDERVATRAALDLLQRFGVAELRDKLPEEISGGQAQRVAIARALVVRPALVLADEPTGQLDSHTAAATLDMLLACLDECGAALVIATHDPLVAARCPIHWSMRAGQLNAHVQTASVACSH